ncbi:MAG: hypothetical protein P8H13_03995 [Polaribacter sp.]|nr:hypothetical protein [Polaribacter sp.]MDG1811086.1 hypothetical protein [Polaribacter sp.]MDG1994406.1 hypothetical protein [Polaribacter sp.]
MKKIIFILLVILSGNMMAQSPYEKEMSKAMQLWSQQKNTEAVQLFERIASAEKDNWLPSYYAATVLIVEGFSIKDEVKLTTHLKRAQDLLDTANYISKSNPEIIITQAMLNTVYVAFDGQKYGMKYAGENAQLYAAALKIAPNNPRVVLGKAQWDIGAAAFFGQSTEPFCKEIKRAIELFKKEKQKEKFAPFGGVERAQQALKEQCVK